MHTKISNLGCRGKRMLRLRSQTVLVFLVLVFCGASLVRSQDAWRYTEGLFADRTILSPESSYPLVALAGDSKGNIFVLAFDQIVKLDDKGRPLKRLLFRKGQGPGEVRNFPFSMTMGFDDNLYINDGTKVLVYTTDIAFSRNIPVMTADREFYVNKDGDLFCRKNDYTANPPEEFLACYSPKGILMEAFLRVPDLSLSSIGGMIIRTPHPYVPRNIFCLDQRGVMFYLPNVDSEVRCLDPKGGEVAAFKVDFQRISISGDEKAEAERIYVDSTKSNFPARIDLHFADFRPYYRKMLIDENARFYLVRNKSVLSKETDVKIDVYQNGRKIMEVRTGGDPLLVRGGSLYYLINGDDGIGELTGAIMRLRLPW